MAQDDLVDGDGCMSDDSSFYGDEDARAACELAAHRPLKRAYHSPVPQVVRKKLKLTTSPNDKPHTKMDVFSFSKSRSPMAESKGHHTPASPVGDLVEAPKHWAGPRSSWQRNETIEDFLRRNPIDEPSTAMNTLDGEGWLWVASPMMPRAQAQKRKPCDMAAFKQGSRALLEAFQQQRAAVEREYFDRVPSTITRKMTPYRDQLESDLLTNAVSTGMTSGKWMIFPRKAELPHVWRAVAIATSEGKLGATSKTAVFSPQKADTLICIYNDNFSDSDDVCRVLKELVELDLCSAGGKPIYYKCDAYTHLEIFSDNEYKLQEQVSIRVRSS